MLLRKLIAGLFCASLMFGAVGCEKPKEAPKPAEKKEGDAAKKEGDAAKPAEGDAAKPAGDAKPAEEKK